MQVEPNAEGVLGEGKFGAGKFEQIHYRMRFPALDGLRALAVSMVFAFHYGGGAHGGRILQAFNAVRLQGWAGVDIFFVLSGFLITGVLYDTRHDSRFFTRFYTRRSLRIFPVYYLVAAVLLALTPVFRYGWHEAHLLFLVYLGNIPGAFAPSLYQVHARVPAADVYLGHLWSLCLEEQFYLLWPMLVWLIRSRVKLLWTAAALSAVSLTLRLWMVLGSGLDLRGGWLLKMLPFHMDTLLIGAVLALLLRGAYAARWQKRSVWVFAGATTALAGLFAKNPTGDGRWMSTVGFTLIALASAGLMGMVLVPGSLMFRVLTLKPLQTLGRYSYGFYVYHLLFASAWAALTRVTAGWLHSTALASGLVMLLNFGVTFLIAGLSYEFFEVRFLRWKDRFSYDPQGPVTVTPTR